MNDRLEPWRDAIEAQVHELDEAGVLARMHRGDHTLWRPDPDEIANRLGWLDAPAAARDMRDDLVAFANAIRIDGTERVVVLGMGGSSLAPEVLAHVFGPRPGAPVLSVLDGTVPGTVIPAIETLDPARTLFIVSSKSGGTIETISLFKAFYRRTAGVVGPAAAGARFVAVTDPGSDLAALAKRLGFRRTFLADPNVGGRFSALTPFGLVPAAIAGIDPAILLDPIGDGAAAERDGLRLGATLAVLAAAGRDKLTFVADDAIAPLGIWLEQLLAESTGKDGKGLLPIDDEPLAAPESYGPDRVFVRIRLGRPDAEDPRREALDALAAAGHPVVDDPVAVRAAVGAAFLRWEVATAVVAIPLGVQPFDQPDVEAAKTAAREALAAYERDGALPEEPDDGAGGDLGAFLDGVTEGGYVAIQAFLPAGEETEDALAELRAAIGARSGRPTTLGWGPRYLHSTGQLHKGDAGKGSFVMLTTAHDRDWPIPTEPDDDASTHGFALLADAQALGDRRALRAAGRRVLWLRFDDDAAVAVRELAAGLAGA